MAYCPKCHKEKPMFASHCSHCTHSSSVGDHIMFEVIGFVGYIIGFGVILALLFG